MAELLALLICESITVNDGGFVTITDPFNRLILPGEAGAYTFAVYARYTVPSGAHDYAMSLVRLGPEQVLGEQHGRSAPNPQEHIHEVRLRWSVTFVQAGSYEVRFSVGSVVVGRAPLSVVTMPPGAT